MGLQLVKAVPESGATRDLLIRGAEQQIAAKGLEGLTFRNLAETLGIRVHTIYACFSSPEDLISGVAARYGTALAELFADNGLRDPTSVLLEGAGALVRHFAENPAHLRLEKQPHIRAEPGSAQTKRRKKGWTAPPPTSTTA